LNGYNIYTHIKFKLYWPPSFIIPFSAVAWLCAFASSMGVVSGVAMPASSASETAWLCAFARSSGTVDAVT
jgi:hypothetical protein